MNSFRPLEQCSAAFGQDGRAMQFRRFGGRNTQVFTALFQALLFATGFTICGGCQSPWSAGGQAQTLATPATIVQVGDETGAIQKTSATSPAASAMKGQDTEGKTQEAAMAEVLSDLEEIGAIDPVAKQQLLADLHEAKPENWSLIVQQFRSALAFRQQLAERESQTPTSSPFAFRRSVSSQALPASHETSEKTTTVESAAPSRQTEAEPLGSAVLVSDATHQEQAPTHVAILPSAKPLLKPTISARPKAIAIAAPTQHKIEQANYEAGVAPVSRWQEHVQSAMTELEKATTKSPGSSEEVHDHMRLRMLRMLAGQEEQSLMPIPGASSLQQDYWSKQLFAMSTFLDSQRQPDNKRRAAGSLLYLDQARAKLSEMATLQIRNLLFVESVEGYGVYEAREGTKFRPGDQVTLYTEIDNFRSESTKEGYRTALGTSYEVLDTKGQRVDSAQFPDIEDLCQNQRRDFHMQYGVALPTRIYPGEYELRITITDQLSHKISQQSVPFEIVE